MLSFQTQSNLSLADRIWVYGVVVHRAYDDGSTRKFVKFGVHRCNSREEAMKYAADQTEGKTRGLTHDNNIILCEDVTEEARSVDPGYITGERGAFDDIMRPSMPGKWGIISNDQGGSSTELHEHDPIITNEELRDIWIAAVEEFKTGNSVPVGKVYSSRPYLEDLFTKLEQRPDKFLLGATTGAGKETSTLAVLIREHDLGYGTRYNKRTIHVDCATIPETALELIEELSTVAGMKSKNIYLDFSRIQVYVVRSYYQGYWNSLKPRARRWANNNVTIVDTVNDIPSHRDPAVVPVLIGSFIDIGIKEKDASTHPRYQGLKKRLGIMSIGEAHKFLSREENKIWTNIKKLGAKFLLCITGTPYDFIFNEDRDLYFTEDQRVLFTRNDLYSAKANGDAAYQSYPDMQFYGITSLWNSVIEQMKQDKRWKSDFNGFTWAKFHTYDPIKNKFKYQDLLIQFYRRLLGVTDNFTGQPDPLSIRSTTKLCDFAKRHAIIALPVGTGGVSVHDMLPALVELLKKNGCMGVYKPLVSYDDKLSDIKTVIDGDEQPTATFTCIKLLTGSNIPNWGTFVMLRPIGDSVKFFEQSTGRIIRPAPNKPNVSVFLGDIEAAMNIIVTVEERNALDRCESVTHLEIVHRTLDNYYFFSGDNGEWSEIAMPDLVKAIEEASARGNYGISQCIRQLKTPKNFKLVFNNTVSTVTERLDIITNGNQSAKNSIQERCEQLSLDFQSQRDRDRWYKNMVKSHLARMRLMAYVYDYRTLTDCADAIAEAIWNEDQEVLSMIGKGVDLIPTYIYDTTQIDHVFANRWISQVQDSDISIDAVMSLTNDPTMNQTDSAFVTAESGFAVGLIGELMNA